MKEKGLFDIDAVGKVLGKLRLMHKQAVVDLPESMKIGFEEWLVMKMQSIAEMAHVQKRNNPKPPTRKSFDGTDEEYLIDIGKRKGIQEAFSVVCTLTKDFLYEY